MEPAAFADQIRRTQERYEERAGERAATEARIQAGGPFAADTPERLAKRLSRLRIEPAVAEAVVSGSLSALTRAEVEKVATSPARAEHDFLLLERVIGDNELIEVRFLEAGYRAARSVVRIEVRGASGRVAGYGTGTLVSPRLILSNNHVLGAPAEAANSRAEFGYEHGLDGALRRQVAFALEPETFFLTDPELDYSLVAVAERGLDGAALEEYGWSRLIEAEGKVLLGEPVNIIQHPGGEPKQLALRQNKLVDLLDNFVHYETDTAPGSSGSPVCNDDWEIVALHHSGVPKKNEAGQLLALNGQPWEPSMGEGQLAWIANEGARVSRIIRHVRAQRLSGRQDRLRSDLFELAPPSGVPETTAAGSLHAPAAGRPTLTADGAAVWTLPLQVTVRLGTGSASTTGPAGTVVDAATDVRPAGVAAADEGELQAALAELERARTRRYYDADADAQARTSYYEGIDPTAEPAALYRALSELVRTSHARQPTYKPTRELYPWIDLHPDRKLRSIYSGKSFEAEEFIRADLEMDARRAERLQELSREATSPAELAAELEALEAAFPYNCEHVVPQSWFQKRQPMLGDLHHLFACESLCNSFRGNTPYFEFADFDEAVRHECGKREQRQFEPSAGKGAAARAVLYFLLRYPGAVANDEFESERLPILLAWHQAEPPIEYEQHRNQAIHERQGNRNPLIDQPAWAEQIAFAAGLG